MHCRNNEERSFWPKFRNSKYRLEAKNGPLNKDKRDSFSTMYYGVSEERLR